MRLHAHITRRLLYIFIFFAAQFVTPTPLSGFFIPQRALASEACSDGKTNHVGTYSPTFTVYSARTWLMTYNSDFCIGYQTNSNNLIAAWSAVVGSSGRDMNQIVQSGYIKSWSLDSYPKYFAEYSADSSANFYREKFSAAGDGQNHVYTQSYWPHWNCNYNNYGCGAFVTYGDNNILLVTPWDPLNAVSLPHLPAPPLFH